MAGKCVLANGSECPIWSDDIHYPIRGNEEYEYFYDIWSNIHFGYVGASVGFDRETLQLFAGLEHYVPSLMRGIVRWLVGQYDPGDAISVDIGVDLWERHRHALARADLHASVLAATRLYFESQDVNGNGEIDPVEIDPVIGKLLPRGTQWSDWR